jgi:O-antigen ligase
MNLLPIIILGIFIGLLITIDPIITIWADSITELNIFGHDLLKLYPFEVTSILFLTIILIMTVYLYLKSRIYPMKDKILIALIIASPQFKSLSIGFIEVTDIFILFFFTLWLIDVNKEDRFVLNTPLQLLVLLLVFSSTLSVINGGIESLLILLRLFKTIVYSFILISLIRNRDDFIWLFRSLFILLALSSLIAILQEVLFLTTGMLVVGKVSASALDLMFQNTFLGFILRAPAFFGYPQAFARTLAFTIPVLLLFLLDAGMRRYFNIRSYLICLSLMSVAIFLTYSRPSWIGAIVGVAIFTYIKKPSLLIHFAIAILIVITLGLITGLAGDVQKVVYEEIKLGGDLQDRLTLAKESLEKVDRHLLIGAGLGKGARYTANVHNWPAHNGFILSIVNTGLIGFVLYSLSFVYIYIRMLTIIFHKDDITRVISLGMLSGVSGYLIAIQFMTGFMDHGYFIYIISPSAAVVYHYLYDYEGRLLERVAT